MSDLLEKAASKVSRMTDSLGLTDSLDTQHHSMLHKNTLNNPNYPPNRAVVLDGDQRVIIKDIGYPEFLMPDGTSAPHGVILKVVASCICGSDLHMYRYRTSAAPGMVFGHEITGLVVETGPNVEILKVGDIVSVPFNISCGLCDLCKQGQTNLCIRCNKAQPGAAPGYTDAGGFQGGQSEYVMIPYADWNLLQLPRDLVKEKLIDFACLTDILPTALDGAVKARVTIGSTVYIAGAGPVGLSAVICCFLLGAAHVVVGDFLPERLKLAEKLGAKTIDLSSSKFKGDIMNDGGALQLEIERLIGVKEVNCSIDCVGYEASEIGKAPGTNNPEIVLNTCMAVTGAAGSVGFPGLYFPMDPKGPDTMHKTGFLPLRIGHAFVKSLNLQGGQCPVMMWNKKLLKMICANRLPPIAKALNVKVITLDQAPEAYKSFNGGEACKYIIDPHGFIANPSLLDQEIAQRNPDHDKQKDKNYKMTPS